MNNYDVVFKNYHESMKFNPTVLISFAKSFYEIIIMPEEYMLKIDRIVNFS